METFVVDAAESNSNTQIKTNTEALEAANNTTTTATNNNNKKKELVVEEDSGDTKIKSTAIFATDDDAKNNTESSTEENKKKNLIQVSNNNKPFIFYLNLAKRYVKQYNGVELTALGMAIPTVITISEILKQNGLAIQKNVKTSAIDSKENDKGRLIQKAKIEIVLRKAEKLDKTTVTTASKKVADANP